MWGKVRILFECGYYFLQHDKLRGYYSRAGTIQSAGNIRGNTANVIVSIAAGVFAVYKHAIKIYTDGVLTLLKLDYYTYEHYPENCELFTWLLFTCKERCL